MIMHMNVRLFKNLLFIRGNY